MDCSNPFAVQSSMQAVLQCCMQGCCSSTGSTGLDSRQGAAADASACAFDLQRSEKSAGMQNITHIMKKEGLDAMVLPES
jgi:hypothetical protein